MDDPKFQQHGGPHAAEHKGERKTGRPMHHSPFFWVAVVFILLGIGIYIFSLDLSVGPGGRARPAVPAAAP